MILRQVDYEVLSGGHLHFHVVYYLFTLIYNLTTLGQNELYLICLLLVLVYKKSLKYFGQSIFLWTTFNLIQNQFHYRKL